MDYEKILKELTSTILSEGASDLHLSSNRRPIIRVSGALLPLIRFPEFSLKDVKGILDQLINDTNKKRLEENRSVDFSYGDGDVRFRGNAFFRQNGLSIALRYIPKQIRTIKDLSLPEQLEMFARKKQGFFLVVGPMGQGKTTTIAALIDMINQTRAEHILTIEDPIEYVYESQKSIIDQREVRVDTTDFSVSLVQMLRQDVNVALIGEMRDTTTMSAAITAAETGHFIFSTLHTNNASQTINRIIDSFPPNQQEQIRVQLASSLSGIFSQRLIPRVSGGLVPAYELLIANNAISNLIREKRVHEIDTVIETSSGEGMIDLNRCLAELVRAGEISAEDAYMHSLNPKVLARLL